MSNPFADHAGGLTAPFAHIVATTPGVDLPTPSRGLFVGVGGDVAVRAIGGETAVFKNVPSGALLPIRATRVETVGTTAADIIAGW